jgi:transcriptional regulator with XRE-family HTH domain
VKGERTDLEDVFVMTQAEVATAMGITRGTVNQIERRAIAKMRRALGVEWSPRAWKRKSERSDPKQGGGIVEKE